MAGLWNLYGRQWTLYGRRWGLYIPAVTVDEPVGTGLGAVDLRERDRAKAREDARRRASERDRRTAVERAFAKIAPQIEPEEATKVPPATEERVAVEAIKLLKADGFYAKMSEIMWQITLYEQRLASEAISRRNRDAVLALLLAS